MTRKSKIWIGIAILVAIGIAFGVKTFREKLMVHLPDYEPIQNPTWLAQNWSDKDRQWYHHADQGTVTFGIPLEWFMALEQPLVSLGAVGLLSDPAYLDRYGFIPGSADGANQALPVGFARGGPMPYIDNTPWLNPQTKKVLTGVGLTCAACHTGRLTYGKTTLLVDGGSALLDLGQLRQGLGLSVLFTRFVPFRFDRFAARVLGPGASDQAKADLRKQLDEVWDKRINKVRLLDQKVEPQTVTEGFGRLDALNRIGNQVFGLSQGRDENYVGTSAPVHFPRIWDASWFDWVQYNGSIEQPMVRNAGEALGVGALVNLVDPSRGLFASSVQVNDLFEIEKLLAGKQPSWPDGFSGLRSPKWPDILPPFDKALAATGAGLYRSNCQPCHMAPVASKEFWDSKRWLPPNKFGQRYLEMELIDVKHIGTDPAQAEDMQNRKVTTPTTLGITSDKFGPALGQLVEKTTNYWYSKQTPPVSQERRDEMNGYRDNGIQDPLKYKVRPLNGVWATPPYLHNGSVPTVYALLSPVSERPPIFYLGNREYDPEKLGYKHEEFPGGFKFDTSIRGNRNTGHEFSNDKRDGVIGRFLKPEERRALIEYLKSPEISP